MPFGANRGLFLSPQSADNLWTPADTDTNVWLDAFGSTDLTLSGTNVTQWDNKANSGSATNFTQTTSSLQPRWDATNQCVTFDGVDDFMGAIGTHGIGGNPDWTTIAVIEFVSKVGVNDRFFQLGEGGTGAANGVAISGGTGSGNGGWSWRYNIGYESFGSVTASVQYVTSWVRPAGGNFASSQLFLDGTENTRDSGYNDSATPNITSASSGPSSTIGKGQGGGSGSFFANIRIHELVTMESSVVADRQKLEGYAAWRWGLEGNLPVGHPYKTAAPTA